MKHLFIAFIFLFFASGCDVSWVTHIAPPTSPIPTDPQDTTATIKWLAPSVDGDGGALTDLAGYNIYHDVAVSVCKVKDPIVVVGPESLDYSFSNLTPGRHYFNVSAFDEAGNESVCASEVFKDI